MPTTDPPTIPSAEEIYHLLMGQIEPDLLRENLPLLTQKYASETPQDRAARKQRYIEAFRKYHEALQSFTADMQAKIKAYKREAARSLEEEDRRRTDEESVNAIEASFAVT